MPVRGSSLCSGPDGVQFKGESQGHRDKGVDEICTGIEYSHQQHPAHSDLYYLTGMRCGTQRQSFQAPAAAYCRGAFMRAREWARVSHSTVPPLKVRKVDGIIFHISFDIYHLAIF